jgi:hypothetical protein
VLPKPRERIAQIVLRHRPSERRMLARIFLQRLAIGRDRLLELPRPALPLPKPRERIAQIALRRRPFERRVFARLFLQRLAIGRHRLLEAPRPALALPEPRERIAQTVLRHRPFERRMLARIFLQRLAIGRDRLLEAPPQVDAEGQQHLVRAKSRPTYCPIGPYLTTGVDAMNLDVWTKLNGSFEQQGNTSDMLFSVDEMVAYFSTHMVLSPGDLLATGTPPGVGFGKNRFMAVGDVLECGIADLGAQRHEIQA